MAISGNILSGNASAMKRQRPKAVVGLTTVMTVSLLMISDLLQLGSAWQPQPSPAGRRGLHSTATSTTARQYAVETEIVAATAATTKPPTSSTRESMPSKSRSLKTVTQIHQADKQGGSGKKTELLSREEEAMYAYQVRMLRAAIRKRDELAADRVDELPEEEWAAACGTTVQQLRKWLVQGREAREVLCAANVGLVASVARKYANKLRQVTQGNTILTFQDLIQEGNLGLLTAAERFEPERGFKFSTYAVFWIRQRILRSIDNSSRVIRLPSHIHGILSKLHRYKADFRTKEGRDPTPIELADALDISTSKLEKLTQSSLSVVSLQAPIMAKHDDTRTVGDVLASAAPSPEEECHRASLQEDVQHVLETVLTDQERAVVSHRYGLKDVKPLSIALTANTLGVSRETVRLIETRALHKLRESRDCRLKDYVAETPSKVSIPTLASTQSLRGRRTKPKIWESQAWDPAPVGSTVAPKPLPSSVGSKKPSASHCATVPSSKTAQMDRSDRLWFF